jgi:ribokinase
MESQKIPEIVIVGGTVVEITMRCSQIPAAYQSVKGNNITYSVSGAGPVQAVQACLCGCKVHLVSKIGGDAPADFVSERLDEYDIDLCHLSKAAVKNTAVNLTLVNEAGENAVCYYNGANGSLTVKDIDTAESVFAMSDVCMLAGSLPADVVVRAVKLAKIHSKKVILNPSSGDSRKSMPLDELPAEYFLADVLLMNLDQAADMTEQVSAHLNRAKLIASDVVARGAGCAIVTMGKRGSLVLDRDSVERLDGYEVEMVDKSGSGDAFAGALAAYYAVRDDIKGAVVFASAAGALACTKFGTLESLPNKADIIQLLQRKDAEEKK